MTSHRCLSALPAVVLLAACASSEPPPPAASPPPVPAIEPAPGVPADPPVAANQPPVIRHLELTPDQPHDGDTLRVQITAEDPEQRGLTFRYTWTLNGVEDVAQHGDAYTARFRRGDVVGLTAVARDDEQDSEPSSTSITVRGKPPELQTAPNQLGRFDGVRLRATDPDGGEVTWSLTGGPEGMSVTPEGVLRYKGSDTEPGGSYTVQITATDADGDYARMELPITISPGSAAARPAAP